MAEEQELSINPIVSISIFLLVSLSSMQVIGNSCTFVECKFITGLPGINVIFYKHILKFGINV